MVLEGPLRDEHAHTHLEGISPLHQDQASLLDDDALSLSLQGPFSTKLCCATWGVRLTCQSHKLTGQLRKRERAASEFRRFCEAITIALFVFMLLGGGAEAAIGRHTPHAGKTRRRVILSRIVRTARVVNSTRTQVSGKPPDSNEAKSSQHRAGHLAETPPDENLSLPDQSTGVFRKITSTLNGVYDNYEAFKTEFNNDYHIQYSLLVSNFAQWGVPHGGPGITEIVYSPTITWNPFSNTRIGSGSFNFAFQGNQFWSKTNTDDQTAAMGVLAPPNDWGANSEQFAQLTYTHTIPGNTVAVSIGQYSIAQFDDNEYAGNAQTNFISYPLSQNGTQTYSDGGVGVYLQITPNGKFAFAGGFQEATNVTADTIEANLGTGKFAYFLNGLWTPSFLAGGTYSFLFYHQPSVPQQTSSSYGYSFSAVQKIDSEWAVFSRINNASGQASAILTSLAGGVAVNNPFRRNELDEFGLGVVRDWTNQSVTGTPANYGEWLVESYYNFTIFKALRLTPDIQVYINPGLDPATEVAAVFSLRATLNL
jgi:hypothetical protein